MLRPGIGHRPICHGIPEWRCILSRDTSAAGDGENEYGAGCELCDLHDWLDHGCGSKRRDPLAPAPTISDSEYIFLLNHRARFKHIVGPASRAGPSGRWHRDPQRELRQASKVTRNSWSRSARGTYCMPVRRNNGKEKGTDPFCAQHPAGRSGKRGRSPFPLRKMLKMLQFF